MSKAEALAQYWFHKFNNSRMLFGFASLLILTTCSIYFNFKLGEMNSNQADATSWVMPLSYSFLDVSALVLAMCLFAGLIKGFLLRVVSWAWFGYLVSLSLFACLSYIIALDSMKASSGDEFKRQQLEMALVQANKNVDTWQNNFEKTERHKSKFQSKLDAAIEQRDIYIQQISKLDSSTPPSQVIFERGLAIMPVWMDEDQFRLFARLAFGVAMIITPLLLTGVLVNVLGDGREREVHSLGKPQTNPINEQPEYWSEQAVQDLVEKRSMPENVVQYPVRNGDSVQKGPNSTESGTEKRNPPNRTGQKSDKYKAKMRTAILNRSVPDLKYSTLTDKCGGSKSTARSVLEEMREEGIVTQHGRTWVWKRSEATG